MASSSSGVGRTGGVLRSLGDAPVDPGHWRFDFGEAREPLYAEGALRPRSTPNRACGGVLVQEIATPVAAASSCVRSGSWLGTLNTQPALRALRVAALLLDQDARVIEQNAPAGELLDSLPLSGFRFGVLRRIGSRCTPSVPEAIRLCRSDAPVQLVAMLDGSQPRIVQGTLTRVPCLRPGGAPCYLLLLELPRGEGLQAAQSVAPLFGLTPAEVRVLAGLLDGVSPAAIAEAGGTSLPTVRTQISNILAKTGTTGQSELLVLLSGLR